MKGIQIEKYTDNLTPCIVGKTKPCYARFKEELLECNKDPDTLAALIQKNRT